MNKLLSHICAYNIDFVSRKKASKLSFCSRGWKMMHWERNGLKVYIIEKSSTLKIQKGSTLKTQKCSILQIQKASTHKIQKGSTLKTRKCSTHKIQKGSTLKIQKRSTLNIQKGSTLEIQKGSLLKKLSTQKCLLTYFMLLVFFNSWRHEKIKIFRGVETDYWH